MLNDSLISQWSGEVSIIFTLNQDAIFSAPGHALRLSGNLLAREIGKKVILLTIFFGYSATSEVKYLFYKVMDNPVKYMYKNFCKNVTNGS